ncbi:hypothetical protein BJX76DRAFT_102845 [Aspergillus varians]
MTLPQETKTTTNPLTQMQLELALPVPAEVKDLLPSILSKESISVLGWMMEESVMQGHIETYNLLAPEVFCRADLFYPAIREAAVDAIYRDRESIIDDLLDRVAALPNPGHFADWQLDSDTDTKPGEISTNRPVRRYDIFRMALHMAIKRGSAVNVLRILSRDEVPTFMLGPALAKATELQNAPIVALLVQDLMRDKPQVNRFMAQRMGTTEEDMRVFRDLQNERGLWIKYCLDISVPGGDDDVTAALLPAYLECVVGHPTSRLLGESGFLYALPVEMYVCVSRELCAKLVVRDIPVKLRSLLYNLLSVKDGKGS